MFSASESAGSAGQGRGERVSSALVGTGEGARAKRRIPIGKPLAASRRSRSNRVFSMRTWIASLLLVVTAGWLAADPPRIVIEPRRPVEDPDPPGFIVIRPKGRPAPAPANAAPVQPSPSSPTIATQPAAEKKELLFDYWFVAAVEGERLGYLHWDARVVEKDGKKLWIG